MIYAENLFIENLETQINKKTSLSIETALEPD